MLNQITTKILEPEQVKKLTPDLQKITILPFSLSKKIQTVIFDGEKKTLYMLTTNTYSEQVKQIQQKLTKQGFSVEVFYTSIDGIRIARNRYVQQQQLEQAEQQAQEHQQNAQGLDAISMLKKLQKQQKDYDPGDFIMEIVRLGFQTGASDMHFQPEEDGIHMRLRLDGVLQSVGRFSHEQFAIYLQKLKFIAGAKMNVTHVPQDGRFTFQVGKEDNRRDIDVRVNFMPGIQTESTVIRYLDSTQALQSFESIGFWGENHKQLNAALKNNYGMILITGPTGSGKTTTLYSILQTLNTGQQKIITLEDPIEYKLQGIQQSQINYNQGYDYATGLKACLRHDPDIILVGETRTLETAEISLSASLTGHLVFTTLHTNSALEAVGRLMNMGIQGYRLAPALRMIQAQRLVRRVCSHCVSSKKASPSEQAEIQTYIETIQDIRPDLQLHDMRKGNIPKVQGCPHCNHTGYKGRIAAIEVLSIDDDMRQDIIQQGSREKIMQKARKKGFLTLQEDGYIKMLQGITSVEELRRIL